MTSQRLQEGFFGPDATRAMKAAFDKACSAIAGPDPPCSLREAIAQRIIQLAADGNVDQDRLCEAAVRIAAIRVDVRAI